MGHYLLNSLFVRASATRIRVRSMLLYTRQSLEEDGRSELLSTGIYEDEVEKTGAGWRFARRCWRLRAALDEDYYASYQV